MTVVMTREMSLDEWDEKSENESDQYKVDKVKQEVDSKDNVMHVEMSDL